jgi:dTDP-4-amino-4,6-dideoxygalactose transaminase
VSDLARRWAPFADEIAALTAGVVRSGRAILGREVEAFEREFARSCGVDHCVGVASGTDALELALRALGVGAGDRVATVANAGGYSTAAIRALGAEPAYVEVEEESLDMSPSALEAAFAAGPIDAVIVTHLYGRMARIEELAALCAGHGAKLLEDCAQAHGAERGGRKAGAWGDAAAFSFYPTKNLGTLGDGGAIVTPSASVAEAARELREYGWRPRFVVSRPGGRNSRLDELQAAILRRFLPELDRWNDRRRAIAARYLDALRGGPLRLPAGDPDGSVWHLFVVRCAGRDGFRERLARLGVATDVHYPVPDHRQPATPAGCRLPVTEACCRSVVSLPCFPELTDGEVARVIAAVGSAAAR